MKALIFDMDGLMIDSERLYFEAERELAKKYNKTVNDETLWKMMGRKPLEALKIFIDDLKLPITTDELLEIRDKIMLIKYKNELLPMKGLFEIIKKFHKKMKLAVATGAQKKFLDIVINKLNLKNFFNVLMSSDTIINGKPDPEIYLKTIKKLKLLPGECIVLEDSENGALAGKKAGCYTIAVASEYTKYQNFDFADYKAEDLIDAMNHINNLITIKK